MWGESQVSDDFPKIDDKTPDDGAGIMTNRWSIEMLESFNEQPDYPPSLSTLTFEGGDLHWRLLH